MARRAPGSSNLATPRKEKDSFEILSGYFNDHTTGTPLSMESGMAISIPKIMIF